MDFKIADIFFLTGDRTIISIKEFNQITNLKKCNWAIFVNGQHYATIEFVGMIELKSQTKHMDECLMEVKQNLSKLKGIDFQANQVILKNSQ